MLKTRALVAVIALPILIVVVVIGGWLFAVLVLVALLLGGDEYVRLLRQGNFNPPEWLVLALIALPWGATWFDHPDWREPGLAFLLIGGALYAIWSMERGQIAADVRIGAGGFRRDVYRLAGELSPVGAQARRRRVSHPVFVWLRGVLRQRRVF